MKKIEFWLNGSGGQRSDKKIVKLPNNYTDEDIKDELDNWVYDLRVGSEYIRYGWKEVS